MSLIRPWTNGDQVALESGNVPVVIYDSNGDPIVLDSGRLPAKADLYDAAGNAIGSSSAAGSSLDVGLHDSAGTGVLLNTGRIPVYLDEKQVDLQDGSGNDIGSSSAAGAALDVALHDSAGTAWTQDANGGMPVNSQITDPNDTTRHALLDVFADVLQSIDYAHSKVHSGKSFISGFTDTSMAASDTIVIAFKTDASVFSHMLYSFATETGGHLDIYKDSTWDNQTGSQLPIYNRNNNSSTSSTLLEDQSSASFVATDNLIVNPTNVSNGNKVIPSDYAFGSVSNPAQDSRAAGEIVLELDTQYTVVFTADTATNQGSIQLNWYE